MSVWYCIPSKRPPEEAEKCLKAWRERGYKIALCVDSSEHAAAVDHLANIVISSPDGYRGYARSVNGLVAMAMEHRSAEWFVTGGDDVFPDPNHTAEEIARECSEHFNLLHINRYLEGKGPDVNGYACTFGVMQCTGDRWGDKRGAYIDRVCGSPWLGREFCRRINQGNGPLWPEYYHMGEDEELQAVAQKYGVLWQRPDLTHHHEHWGRKNALRSDMPEFLEKANSLAEWNKYKEIFQRRQAAGFPGSEPIA